MSDTVLSRNAAEALDELGVKYSGEETHCMLMTARTWTRPDARLAEEHVAWLEAFCLLYEQFPRRSLEQIQRTGWELARTINSLNTG